MKIVALTERASREGRAAVSPETVKLLTLKGFRVFVEKDIGKKANFTNQNFIDAGAVVSSVPLEIISDADVILKVQPSPLNDSINEIAFAKKGAIIIGLLSPYHHTEYLRKVADKGLTAIAMEKMPRITKAQTIDVLSSQSNLAGYRAVILASFYLPKALPMMMTAAGTIVAAKVLVLGTGVAGLQAIATAKRLGAIVTAYDVRPATKEQVESLGAKFVYPEVNPANQGNVEDKSGYATQMSDDFSLVQEKFLHEISKNYDIIITTAQIPGKKAPILITQGMIHGMRSGSVIIDMAIHTGGNVEGSKIDEIVVQNGVTIIAPGDLASSVVSDSTKLYAKNLYNFVNYAFKKQDQGLEFLYSDELVRAVTVVRDGVLSQ